MFCIQYLQDPAKHLRDLAKVFVTMSPAGLSTYELFMVILSIFQIDCNILCYHQQIISLIAQAHSFVF